MAYTTNTSVLRSGTMGLHILNTSHTAQTGDQLTVDQIIRIMKVATKYAGGVIMDDDLYAAYHVVCPGYQVLTLEQSEEMTAAINAEHRARREGVA